MPRKKTLQEFINQMKTINPNIEIIGEYINSVTAIDYICKKDGYTGSSCPSLLLRGHGCPKCYGNVKKTTNEFIEEMKNINPSISIIGQYVNNKTKIKCLCLKDDNIWEAAPSHLLNGKGCPECKKEKISKNKTLSHNEFINRMSIINADIKILSKYKKAQTKIICQCEIDGHKWEATANNLLRGHGCPKCKSSKGEKIVRNYLSNNNIDYQQQKEFDDLIGLGGGLLSFDFYLPSYNLLIEYQGQQHEKPVNFLGFGVEYANSKFLKQQEHDRRKREYAKSNNIKLLEIWYWDYDNVEKILKKELT